MAASVSHKSPFTAPLPNSSAHNIIGWDIGGVNIKAARLGTAGWQVVQKPFAIWQQQHQLVATLADISDRLGPATYAAVTITAELSDAFRNKREGIAFVLDALHAALPHTQLAIFGLDGRFHDVTTANNQHMLVAAANWMATALLFAHQFADCLLVDIGSTTTDIIPIRGGQVAAIGRNDPERLVQGELIYTGVLRTPVFGIVSRVPLWGSWCPVAAELFATAQDVHLVLGNLSAEQCTSPSADGRPVTPEYALERLARVVCADTELLSPTEVTAMAHYIATQQLHQITAAIAQVISRANVSGPMVAVGVGTFLAQAAAAALELDWLLPAELLGNGASDVAPAAAVALLFNEQHYV